MLLLPNIDPKNKTRSGELRSLQTELQAERQKGTAGIQHYYWKSDYDRGLEYYESICRGDNIANVIGFLLLLLQPVSHLR